MDQFKISDLYPYLTLNCPLNDNNFSSTIARIVISYLGKVEITLTAVNYNPNGLGNYTFSDQSSKHEIVRFPYRVCCISSNGSFYVLEGQFDWKKRLGYDLDLRNLKYISSKSIDAFTSDATLQKPIAKNDNSTVPLSSYQK